MEHHLAQLNIGRLRRALDHDETAEFVEALDPVNALAEAAPGFIWRLTDESGQSSSYVALPENDDPLLVVNYSIWSDVESLKDFMYRTDHSKYLPRRREWFVPLGEASTVLWWIPAGTIPTLGEAYDRLKLLRKNGPGPEAFGLSKPPPKPV